MATAAQLVSNLSTNADSPPVSILYAAPSLDALQLVPELVHAAADTGKVHLSVWCERIGAREGLLSSRDGAVEAHVKFVPGSWYARSPSMSLSVAGHTVPLRSGRISIHDLGTLAPNMADALVLVCGPDGYVWC